MSLEIVSMILTTKAIGKQKPGKTMIPKGITIHETDNFREGADALSHGRALLNGNIPRAWHYTVDDRHAIQHLKDTEQGWHAGDGNGFGNSSTIGIEICVHSNGDYDKSVANAAKLTAIKLLEHGLNIDDVFPHKKHSGKNCPQKLLKNWSAFLMTVQRNMVQGKSAEIPSVTVYRNGKKLADGLLKDGISYVPVRSIAENYGSKVSFNKNEMRVDIND